MFDTCMMYDYVCACVCVCLCACFNVRVFTCGCVHVCACEIVQDAILEGYCSTVQGLQELVLYVCVTDSLSGCLVLSFGDCCITFCVSRVCVRVCVCVCVL